MPWKVKKVRRFGPFWVESSREREKPGDLRVGRQRPGHQPLFGQDRAADVVRQIPTPRQPLRVVPTFGARPDRHAAAADTPDGAPEAPQAPQADRVTRGA